MSPSPNTNTQAGKSLPRKVWQTAASIKTGVVLLILVVILAAAGTIILQRPMTDPDDMQRTYSPQALRLLDATGMTDVFHAWWFLGLMGLVSVCIIAASIERFPNAWRYYSRPYKYPDASFRRALHPQKSIAVADEETGLVAAERALHSLGLKPETGGAGRPLRNFLRAPPHLRDGRLHRARQPAADFLWLDHRWRLRLARIDQPDRRPNLERDCVARGQNSYPPVCHPLRCRRTGELQGRHSQEVVVEAGGRQRRARCEGERDRGERSAALWRRALLPGQLWRDRKGGQTGDCGDSEPGIQRREFRRAKPGFKLRLWLCRSQRDGPQDGRDGRP